MSDCVCQQDGVLMFPCSGGSDVGELSDRVARKMAACGQAKMFCLAGVGANIPGIIAAVKAAKTLIAIDGCQMLCAKKILQQAGFSPLSFNLKEYGFEKGKTTVNQAAVDSTAARIAGGTDAANFLRPTDGCCGS